MKAAAKPTGYVIYRGPSLLNGAPIVAVALVGKSQNDKTGNMVQTYILPDVDVRPSVAANTGLDAAVCGDCKHRPANGGACYVVLAQGPTVVWKGVQAGKYPEMMAYELAPMLAGRMVRLGTYGDPAAVPAQVWRDLVAHAAGRTGYTHQWNNPALDAFQKDALRELVMASADTLQEAQEARSKGLRYFRIRVAGEPLQAREFMCPASEEAGKKTNCAQCGACNGSEKPSAASPVIVVHGFKARKFSAQRSL